MFDGGFENGPPDVFGHRGGGGSEGEVEAGGCDDVGRVVDADGGEIAVVDVVPGLLGDFTLGTDGFEVVEQEFVSVFG